MFGQVLELSAEKYVPIIMNFVRKINLPKDFPPGLNPKDTDPEHRKEMMEKWKQYFKDHGQPKLPAGQGKDET